MIKICMITKEKFIYSIDRKIIQTAIMNYTYLNNSQNKLFIQENSKNTFK